MDRWCPNCGRPMGEFEPGCGPGGLGCMYCTKHCPRCHREIFDQDTRYDEDGQCCKDCYKPSEAEILQEKALAEERVRRSVEFSKNHPILDLIGTIFLLIVELAVCGLIFWGLGWLFFH